MKNKSQTGKRATKERARSRGVSPITVNDILEKLLAAEFAWKLYMVDKEILEIVITYNGPETGVDNVTRGQVLHIETIQLNKSRRQIYSQLRSMRETLEDLYGQEEEANNNHLW